MWRSLVAVALAACSFEGGANQGGRDAALDSRPADAAVDAREARACDDNVSYLAVPGSSSTFRFADLSAAWNQARAFCLSDEAELARVQSRTLMDGLLNELGLRDLKTSDCIFGGNDVPCAWVGLFQDDQVAAPGEGWFFVGGGGPFAGDDPLWRPGEPDDGGGGETGTESCGALSTNPEAGLEDRDCNILIPVICECS